MPRDIRLCARRRGARCKSKTSRHDEDRSRQNVSVIGCAARPVLIVATGLGFATRPAGLKPADVSRTHGKVTAFDKIITSISFQDVM